MRRGYFRPHHDFAGYFYETVCWVRLNRLRMALVFLEFGENGRRSKLITWYVFDPDKFRRHEPGWCGTSITEYRNGFPFHVTLLDAAGLEVEAWAVDGDGRRVADFSGPR
jgi:hypothetical protein